MPRMMKAVMPDSRPSGWAALKHDSVFRTHSEKKIPDSPPSAAVPSTLRALYAGHDDPSSAP
jgi:hypothetical protein